MLVCAICNNTILNEEKIIESKRQRYFIWNEINEPIHKVHLNCLNENENWINPSKPKINQTKLISIALGITFAIILLFIIILIFTIKK